MLNKSDYIAWRDSKETKMLHTEVAEAMERSVAEIVTTETWDSDRVQFLKGCMKAFEQVLTWRPEFVEDSNED